MGFLWWRVPEIRQELHLSGSQVIEIERIFQSYKGELKKYRKKIVKKEKKLRKLLNDPSSEKSQIKSLSKKVHKLKIDARSIKMDMYLDIRDILSVKQRQNLREIKRNYKRSK